MINLGVIFVSLLEDVMVNAKAAVTAVGQTAGKLVDISKLRYSAGELNSEISKRYEALGRAVYESVKSGNNSSEFMKERVEAIEKLNEQLEAVNDQIAIMKNRVKCKNCGFENEQAAVYCNRCGVRLSEQPVAAKEEEQTPGSPTCEQAANTKEVSQNEQAVDKAEEPSVQDARTEPEKKTEE